MLISVEVGAAAIVSTVHAKQALSLHNVMLKKVKIITLETTM